MILELYLLFIHIFILNMIYKNEYNQILNLIINSNIKLNDDILNYIIVINNVLLFIILILYYFINKKDELNNNYLPKKYYLLINNNPSKDNIIEAMNILYDNIDKLNNGQYLQENNRLKNIYDNIIK